VQWLWFQDFSLGVAVIFAIFGVVGLGRMFLAEPGRTARRLGGIIAWFQYM
jgi:hypothetical protein